MIEKSIKELAWNVTEETYREDPAVSYSMLAAFFRGGPSVIPHLKEKKSTAALKRGSLVDTLLTEPDEFDNKFLISDIDKPSELMCKIVEALWNKSDKVDNNINALADKDILSCANSYGLYPGYKETTRVTKVKELGGDYFSLLALVGDRILMSQFEYQQAIACIDALKSNSYTKEYFNDDMFAQDMEYHYQLKFRIEDKKEPNVRCMFDRIIVNHKGKTIQPCDLKTTGHEEIQFEHSFIEWSYWIQSNMYSQILQYVCSKDPYFKDFTILPFKFIVINRDSLSPMVWTDPSNLESVDKEDRYGNKYPYWKTLYKQFQWHVNVQEYKYPMDVVKNHGDKVLSNLCLCK